MASTARRCPPDRSGADRLSAAIAPPNRYDPDSKHDFRNCTDVAPWQGDACRRLIEHPYRRSKDRWYPRWLAN
jgi:hypothetical protein